MEESRGADLWSFTSECCADDILFAVFDHRPLQVLVLAIATGICSLPALLIRALVFDNELYGVTNKQPTRAGLRITLFGNPFHVMWTPV